MEAAINDNSEAFDTNSKGSLLNKDMSRQRRSKLTFVQRIWKFITGRKNKVDENV